MAADKSTLDLNKIMSNQTYDTVKWRDDDGKRHQKKITLQDPGIGVASRILDDMNTGDNVGDFGEIFELCMEYALVNPHLNYEILNKELPKELQTRDLKKKNKQGEDVVIPMHFPGFRDALQTVMMAQRTNGASNFHDTLQSLNENVFKDAKGNPIDEDFWEPGGDGDGLGFEAMGDALNYLGECVSKNGVLDILTAVFQFCIKSLRPNPRVSLN